MKLAAVALSIGIATVASAQSGPVPVTITNAKLETRPLPSGGSLVSEVSRAGASGPTWLAWRIATNPNFRSMCCSSDRCSWGCSLADGGNWNSGTCAAPEPPAVAHLEGSREAFVFVRVENAQVNRIRTFSRDCQIDAGGLPVVYFADVLPATTLVFLKTFVHWDSGRLAEDAVNAIGLLPEPEAIAALEKYAGGDLPHRVRRQAADALGRYHPQRAVPLLTRLVKEDAEPRIREHCVYALSLSKQGTAVLLDIANRKVAADAKAREKAVYWLARSQEPEARRYIEAVLSR